jgi:hypothetical protein
MEFTSKQMFRKFREARVCPVARIRVIGGKRGGGGTRDGRDVHLGKGVSLTGFPPRATPGLEACPGAGSLPSHHIGRFVGARISIFGK